MPNWAFTNYVIEGPAKTLQKIYEAILHPDVQDNSDESWEGNVLRALGISWLDRSQDRENGKYMRGFICAPQERTPEDTCLIFDAQEAWGVTDFDVVLQENIPGIKVYWSSEEGNMGIYMTNDKEGKHFPERFYVDTCINNNYQAEYFKTEEGMWKWLSNLTEGKIKTKEEVEAFNTSPSTPEDDYIYINPFKVI